MKKRICILLCAAMILSAFGGCGGSTQAQASESAAASEAASVSAAEADSEGNDGSGAEQQEEKAEGTVSEQETADKTAQTGSSCTGTAEAAPRAQFWAAAVTTVSTRLI